MFRRFDFSRQTRTRRRFTRRAFLEQLEDRSLLAALLPWQNAANHYDVNADGAASGVDLWLLDQELKAGGERTLAAPNGPVQNFWDVDGDNELSWLDLEANLRQQTGTAATLSSKQSPSLASSESGGGMSLLTCPTVTLNPVGNVYEGTAFSVSGSVSPAGSYFFQAMMDWGQSPGNGGPVYVSTQPNGSFAIPHIYFDDGTSPGNGTLLDGESISLSGSIMGCPISASTSAIVNNVAPVPQLALSNTPLLGGPEYQVSGSVQDASAYDKHTVTIDWGDGSAPTVISNLSTNEYFITQPPHRYPPRQQHEGPIPYLVTASIVDDDTGAAGWGPVLAPIYVLDLDNDADNDWTIDPMDDPIEHLSPGRFVVVNGDDDNLNLIPDLEEAPVSGENDLEEFQLDFTPPPREDVNYYNGWHVTLDVLRPQTTASGMVWQFPDKSGTSVPLSVSDGVLGHWIVGQDSIPPSLYLEATGAQSQGPSEIWLQLRLWNPEQGLVVETDTVVFTVVAVDLDTDSDNTKVIEGSDLEDQDEADHDGILNLPGKIVLRNMDDDNQNGSQDRLDPAPFVDGGGNPVMDNDLVPVKLKLGADPAKLPGFTVVLVPSGQEIKLWKTQDKQATPLSFAVADMPAELYVEGYEYGQPTLEMQLKNAAGVVVASDIVKFTVLTVDAKAYRPYTTPFILVPVPFEEEQEPGVGIRRNGDDDDGNGAPDRTHDPVLGENDLIRVDLTVGPGGLPAGVTAKVGRSSQEINVWDGDNKTDGLLTAASGDEANVSVPLAETSVFTEWASAGGGAATFEFSVWDSLHNKKAFFDDMVFKPFNSIVIVLGGESQVPADPVQFPGEHGTFQLAIDEYRAGPYDIHMYDENLVGHNGIGPVYNEVVSAIQTRGVTDVAIMGYSHGGGSTYVLAWRLEQNTIPGSGIADIIKPFSIPFTGYIDAIDDGGWTLTPETRRPPLSLFHCSQWETNGFPNGAPSGGNDDIDRSYLGVIHDDIEDHPVVIDFLRMRLHEHVSR